jgi:hypothetical protein
MEYLDMSQPEWHRMWDELASYHINRGDALCLNEDHCWEYMGSGQDHHHFRHPCHPLTQKPEYVYIERARAAVSWSPMVMDLTG